MNKVLIALALILVIVMGRYMPHMPNFAPVAAVALFGSVFLGRRMGLLVAISGMLLSDVLIGFYEPMVMLFNYAALTGAVLLKDFGGAKSQFSSRSLQAIGASSLLGSMLFFFISNTGVWAFSGMYAHCFSGLLSCYALAVPFITYTIAGDLFYNTVLFGSAYGIQRAGMQTPQLAAI